MRLVGWVLRGVLFLLLFGLALNNQQEVVVNGLFGTRWSAPMIVVILVSFVAGVVLALLAVGIRRWPGMAIARRPELAPVDATRPAQPSAKLASGPLPRTPANERPCAAVARRGARADGPDPLDSVGLGAADGPPPDGR